MPLRSAWRGALFIAALVSDGIGGMVKKIDESSSIGRSKIIYTFIMCTINNMNY